jgi:hypothetical protein
MGEDIFFCKAARDAGLTLWADLDLSYRVAHIGDTSISIKRPETVSAQ